LSLLYLSRRKYILIVSTRAPEPSTTDVIDWILYGGHRYLKIHGEDLEDFRQAASSIRLLGNSVYWNQYDLSGEFDALWIRRWSNFPWSQGLIEAFGPGKDPHLILALLSGVSRDKSVAEHFILKNIRAKKVLTSVSQIEVNKLDVLLQARRLGLLVPEFLMTTDKEELKTFFAGQEGEIVTKDLDRPFHYHTDKDRYTTYTEFVEKKVIEALPERFYLSFFQRYIRKRYEIRTFILDQEVYAMAVFSQRDPMTRVDSRRYNLREPNRMVPYLLPGPIAGKLKKLFFCLGLKTGSADLLRGQDGHYYFLEVNPVGQYGALSQICNYNLDYKIASYLAT
jgi:ATP-GRASP peptide maturase of grasp-with-spasm system